MKGRAIIPLVMGLGIGLLAVKLGFDYISKARGASADTEVVEVVVCNKDITMTMGITRDMVTTVKIPHALVPVQHVLAKDIDRLVGRVAGVMMSKGSPITERMLAPEGTQARPVVLQHNISTMQLGNSRR